jgi:hypothetical protein
MTTRRDFLLGSMVTLVFVPACGNSTNGTPDTGPAGPSCTSQISANHGHVLRVPASDLMSTTDKTYNIQGTADHSHDVTFTAAQLATLGSGSPVAVPSTLSAGHTHMCMVVCTT